MEVINKSRRTLNFTITELPEPKVLYRGKSLFVHNWIWEFYYNAHRYSETAIPSYLDEINVFFQKHFDSVEHLLTRYPEAAVVLGPVLYLLTGSDRGTTVAPSGSSVVLVASGMSAETVLQFDPVAAEEMVHKMNPSDPEFGTAAAIMAMRPRLHRPDVMQGKSADWMRLYTETLLLCSDDTALGIAVYLELSKTWPFDAFYIPMAFSSYAKLLKQGRFNAIIELLKVFDVADSLKLDVGIKMIEEGIIYPPALVVYKKPWDNYSLLTAFLEEIGTSTASALYKDVLSELFSRQEIRALTIKLSLTYSWYDQSDLQRLMGNDADFIQDPSTWTKETVAILGDDHVINWPTERDTDMYFGYTSSCE